MANIVPRDENQMPREGQIFRVGDVCLASGIYKHSCGGNAHFEKGKRHYINDKPSKQVLYN